MEENQQPNKKRKILKYILFFILAIFLSFLFALALGARDQLKRGNVNKENTNISNFLASQKPIDSPYKDSNYYFGAKNAKITLVEFADFSCPYCSKAYSKIRKLSLKYSKDLKVVFRDYPAHDNSLNQALAARCIGEQNLFWLAHDKLFQNQDFYLTATEKDFIDLANKVGADTKKFEECYKSEKYIIQIKQDLVEGDKLEIKGTPTYFINGYKIDGDVTQEFLEGIINKLINK